MIVISDANLMLFFGHLHPLIVHLPIGFLAALAVLELANRIHHLKHAAQARGLLLALTAASAVMAVTAGLMLSSAGGYDAHLLAWHKWMGIGLAVLCLLTAVAFFGKRHRAYVGLLMLTLLTLGPASHFGGSMTHGADYLTEYAPEWIRRMAGVKQEEMAAIKQPMKPTTIETVVPYRDLIRPILAQNCVSCHNAEKKKGELNLQSAEGILAGGKSGSGEAEGKLMVTRILLPMEDTKHMPPNGKPQPTDDQVAALQWWAGAGTPLDEKKSLAQFEPPSDMTDVATRLLGLKVMAGPVTDMDSIEAIGAAIVAASQGTGAVIETIGPKEKALDVNAAVSRSFGDAELAKLTPIARNIVSLNLAGTKVTDASMTVVAGMVNLKRLRLDRTAVSDAGLANLTKLRQLDYLNLYSTGITDAGLKTLAGLPALKHLYVWKTKTTPAATQALTEAKLDPVKTRRIQQQIAALQAQLQSQGFDLVTGPNPTTAPTTAPATKPATMATKAK